MIFGESNITTLVQQVKMTFSSNNSSTKAIFTQKNIPDTEFKTVVKDKKEKNQVWNNAKSYAHDRLWFGYILPAFLDSEGVDVRKMNTSEMVEAMGDIWDTKLYETNPSLKIYISLAYEDDLLTDYQGDKPTKYNKELKVPEPVTLHGLGTICSNDFRYWVMNGDKTSDPVIPNDVFFGTWPVKKNNEIVKGQFMCVLKKKK